MEELNVWSLVAILVRRWRLIIGVPLTCAVLIVALTWQGKREWTASASFVAQDAVASPGGGGIAATFGLALGGATTKSPQFYADLLRSRSVLSQVVSARLAGAGERGDSADLLTYYKSRTKSPERPMVHAVHELTEALTTRVEAKTGVVHFEVHAGSAALAADIAKHLLRAVDAVNQANRRTQAQTERAFAEQRLRVALDSLNAAEDGFANFQLRNKQWRNSPELSAAASRLERTIALRQAVYVGLAQSVEAARQAEVRSTPTIAVLERPDGFEEIRPRGNFSRIIGALFLGGVLAVGLAFFLEYAKRARESESAGYEEIARAFSRFRQAVGRRTTSSTETGS